MWPRRTDWAFLMLGLFSLSLGWPQALDFSAVGLYAVGHEFLDFTNFKFGNPEAAAHYAELVRTAKQRGQKVMLGLYTWDRVTHKKPLAEVFADTDRILQAIDLRLVDLIFLSEEEVDWAGGFDYLNAIYDHVKRYYQGPVYQWYSAPMPPRWDQKADGWILDAYGMDYAVFRRHIMRFLILGKPVIVCVNATPGVNSLACSQEQVRVCEEFNLPVFYYAVHNRFGNVDAWLGTDVPEVAKWRSWLFRVREYCHSRPKNIGPLPSADFAYAEPVELAGGPDDLQTFRFLEEFTSDGFLQQASLQGFTHLFWSGAQKTLWLKPSSRPTMATLTYHFTSPFLLKSPQVQIRSEGRIAVEMSSDGRRFTPTRQLPELRGHNFWLRLTLSAPPSKTPAAGLRRIEITGGFEGPRVPAMPLLPRLPNDELTHEPPEGDLLYRDDFAAPRFLHIGEITGREDLQWQPGEIRTQGVAERPVQIEIKQHFVSARPLRLNRIGLSCVSVGALGAHNELAFSLDGQTLLQTISTAGRGRPTDDVFSGELTLELANVPQAQSVRDFWLHLRMINVSGRPTGISNRLTRLVIYGGLAPQ